MESDIILSPFVIQNILNYIVPIRVIHIILLYAVYKIYKLAFNRRVI